MLLSLSWRYILLVFVAVAGVLQAAAVHNNLRGMQWFRNRAVAYVFAALAVGTSLYVFFSWNSRYAISVIEGSQQAGLFSLGTVLAIAFTLAVAATIRSAYARLHVVRPGRIESIRPRGVPRAARNRANERH